MNYSALIGNPTDHSVSHVLYSELAKLADLPGFYQHLRIDVEHSMLEESLNSLKTLNFVGINVTLPFKLDIISYLDKLDPVIEDLGAVNTIKLGETTVGYNTDWVGIRDSVKHFAEGRNLGRAVIFGTGGAARAAIYACKQLGVKDITVMYREEKSANTKKLLDQRDRLGIELKSYDEIAQTINDSQLVINTTSAGMKGKTETPFDLSLISGIDLTDKVFHDAVFNPLETPLLRYFKEHGALTIDGLWMMIFQGVQSMSIWFDRAIAIDQESLSKLHTILEKELQHNV